MLKFKLFLINLVNKSISFLKKFRKGFYHVLEIMINLVLNIYYYVYLFLYKLIFTKWQYFKKKEFKKPIKKHYKHVDEVFDTDTYRLIKATKTRFLSLVAIVFVGTAFMMGLLSTASIMRKSIDNYDDEKKLLDIQIYSNYGFSDEDIETLKEIEGVSEAEGSYFVDCYAINQNNAKDVVRVQELDTIINELTLAEGRMPENENECLSLVSKYEKNNLNINDTIHLVKDEEDELDENLKVKDYTIVGLVKTPQYLSEFDTNSTFHNLSLSNVLFVDNTNFCSEYYTTLYLTIDEVKELNSFSDKYFDTIDEYVEDVEELALTQKDVNRATIIAKAKDKIAEAETELEESKAEYESQFKDAKEKLDDANIEIEVGKATIKTSEETIAQTEQEIESQRQTLENSSKQLNNEIAKIESEYGKSYDELYAEVSALYAAYYSIDSLSDGSYNSNLTKDIQDKLDAVNAELVPYETREAELKEELKTILNDINLTELDETLSEEEKEIQIEGLRSQYSTVQNTLYEVYNEELKLRVERDAYQIELDAIKGSDQETSKTVTQNIRAKLDEMAGGSVEEAYDGLLQIKTYEIQIEQGYKTLDEMQATVDASTAQIEEAKAKIESGEAQYNSSLATYNKSLEEYEEEIEKAETEIKKSRQDLEDLSEGKWTILDRNSHYSSALYKGNSEQMQNIGIAFPLLFFLVAALVCMTTMSRLIDEQRNQIGCLVALGYSKNRIIGKYVTYAGIASLAGALPGIFFGVLSFPVVIYSAWGLMYRNPSIALYMPLIPTLISFFSFIILMCLVTYFVVKASLKEIPASLMRPKAPKNMRKTFLEKIGIVWNHLSFTSKITARNIIRYKQRFFMTVVGVAGCCGLLLIGFGITDSISSIVSDQYGIFFKMSHQVEFNDYEDASKIKEYITDNFEATNISEFMSYTTLIKKDDKEATANMVVASEEDLLTYLNLTNHETKEAITFSNTGVIITKKFADNNDIHVGDIISVESKDGIKADVHVEEIATMYYDHFIYMTSDMYYDLFKATVHPNNISFISNYDADEVCEDLLELDYVEKATNVDELTNTFNTMISSLGLITIVIILAAGFLALIVLINLTEVNISERKREIATLKVLGFRAYEVRNYIYKELIILTLIGSLLGIPLGNAGLKFIMDVLNIDMVFFPNVIKPLSYLYAFLTTYIFLAIILFIERKPLRELKMVESLKSVE